MDGDEEEELGLASTAPAEPLSGGTAVNSLILDYYKKFGRKRDLEQYFSLSTAQSDVKDTSGTFWQSMKSENDSSDSGEKKSDSSQELCRISIRCSVPDPCSSQVCSNIYIKLTRNVSSLILHKRLALFFSCQGNFEDKFQKEINLILSSCEKSV